MSAEEEKNISNSHTEDNASNTPISDPTPGSANESAPEPKCKKRGPVGRALRVLMWVAISIVILVLLIPVLIYIPPVQTWLVNTACDIVQRETGMQVEIDRFRLKFPLDISLQGVKVIEATGDTMVMADEALADVKLLPLLELDVQLNKLKLHEGYYRMVSPDSSMVLKLRARDLVVKPGSSCDLKTNTIDLTQADLQGADISLYMNVWKQKYTPQDTTVKPWTIKLAKANLEDVNFAMSMLPTIDTLTLNIQKGLLQDGLIDLNTNNITARYMQLDKGDVVYLTPTQEYIESHPLPPDTIPKNDQPPMTIKADSVCINDFAALYAVKGAKPLPGFDPSYIQVSGVNGTITNFYNQETTLRLPIRSIVAKERSGLEVTQCNGLVAIDSLGIVLQDLNVRTPVSAIDVDANLSYSMMAMEQNGPVSVKTFGHLGLSDIKAFMPDLAPILNKLPQRPLDFTVDASGTLGSVALNMLNANLPGALSLTAQGRIDNALDPKKLAGNIKFNGWLGEPSLVARFVPDMGVHIPTLRLQGEAKLRPDLYSADISMLSPEGNAALEGNVSMTHETYHADFSVNDLNLGYIMPEIGIGHVSAHVKADGAGFDINNPATWTDIYAEVTRLVYRKREFGEVTADVHLDNGEYDIELISYDPMADLNLDAKGHIDNGTYYIDARADIAHLDLKALGISKDTNGGNGIIAVKGSANPEQWLYDLNLDVSNLDWNLPGGQYLHLPQAIAADLLAKEESTSLCVRSLDIDADFDSPVGLKELTERFTAISDSAMQMIDHRRLDVEMLQRNLPRFDMAINASGKGGLKRLLREMDMRIDTLSLALSNQDKLTGSGLLYNFKSGTLALDTITMNLNQRNRLIDYRLHLGNRPGTLDDFARVDVNGYLGGNRASISVKQQDIKGNMGYRLGATIAAIDNDIEVHFTPLDATIAYMPWTFNDDNYVQYNLANNDIHALLYATSNESRIDMRSEPNADGDNTVCIKLDKIHIEDFLRMSVTAPPVTGVIDADIDLVYKGNAITGQGYLNSNALTYDRMKVGDLGFDFNAALDFEGNTNATIGLSINENKVLTGHAIIDNDTVAKKPMEVDLALERFPLSLANPFIGKDVATLKGYLNGKFAMTGSLTKPLLNGHLECEDASAYVNMIGTTLRLDTVPVTLIDNVLDFNNFSVWAANNNPLRLSGTVDARSISNPLIDLSLNAENMQLVGNDKRAGSDIYGKLFYNLNATAKGSMKYLAINANVNILSATDVFYNLSFAQQTMTQNTNAGVVKFVNLQDSDMVAKKDTIGPMMNMKIGATLTISQGAKATVNLSGNGTDRVIVNPSGTLTYNQNVMGDMRLNGRLNTGAGSASYNIPAIGNKQFDIDPDSYVLWNGDIMNPVLHINAVDHMKANVSTGGQAARSVNFDVGLAVTGTLSAPKVQFDLSTTDDMTIQNELQSMSADQRSNQAMNMLLYGAYTGAGSKTTMDFSGEGMLYSFLESQLNSWAANHIRGVDLSFGINQFDTNNNGQAGTAMSYSYQVSKSLFNNRFKIVVGGNYSTDASADENFAQNLISDISFEYTIKQTNNLNILAKLFRHTGYESILEGEVSETGVGLVMRRKLSNLKQLFRFRFGRRNRSRQQSEDTDTIPGIRTVRFPTAPDAISAPKDAVPDSIDYDPNTGLGY